MPSITRRLPLAAAIIIAASAASIAGASAQTQPQPAPPAATEQSKNIPDQKIDAAAQALVKVIGVQQDYQQRIAAAPQADKPRLTSEANSALVKAVTDQGLSVDEYNSILQVAQNDPTVREKIRQRIQPPPKQ